MTASEQVRQILEVFTTSFLEYGRKISSYESTEIIDDKEMVVNILVIGRVGMFYQTKDEQQSYWNRTKLGETGKNYLVIEQQLEMELGW